MLVLFALDSVLGYILSGQTKLPHSYSTNLNVSEHCALNVSSEIDVMKDFWDSEKELNVEMDQIFENFKKDITFNENRYTVKLPVKDNIDTIDDNFELSKGRLKSLYNKFIKDNDFFEEYNKVFEGQLADSIIEKVTDDSLTDKIHYLPHSCFETK